MLYDVFLELVSVDTDECILWPHRTTHDGYAVIGVGNGRAYRSVYLSRVACEMRHGPPSEPALQAAHSCRHRNCINPRHLSWKTLKDNVADKLRDGTDNRGVKHWNAKLSEVDVLEIRRLRGLPQGERPTYAEISEQFGIHKMHAYYVSKGEKWGHL